MRLWETLSEENKEKLAQVYEQLTGKKWIPPKQDKRGIHCELKIDSKEVEKTMTEKPNYSVESKGR